jgi:hypothetical protein
MVFNALNVMQVLASSGDWELHATADGVVSEVRGVASGGVLSEVRGVARHR